jgi:hypothetical protein
LISAGNISTPMQEAVRWQIAVITNLLVSCFRVLNDSIWKDQKDATPTTVLSCARMDGPLDRYGGYANVLAQYL